MSFAADGQNPAVKMFTEKVSRFVIGGFGGNGSNASPPPSSFVIIDVDFFLVLFDLSSSTPSATEAFMSTSAFVSPPTEAAVLLVALLR